MDINQTQPETEAQIDPAVLAAIFSDDTENFRSPSEPDRDDTVKITLRVLRGSIKRAVLRTFDPLAVVMSYDRNDGYFDYYSASIVALDDRISYCFTIETPNGWILYDRLGARPTQIPAHPDPAYSFRFTPGFHVPEWSKGAVQYQIFTDRFCNGNQSNDVCDNEYYYVVGHSKHVDDWNTPPNDTDIRCFYGGDLQGVMQKLDYLQDLGVEVIYFNPLFVSPSSHKYDIQDYEHIDPHFAVIKEDIDYSMQAWEKHNGYAPRYIKRTTSMANLAASDDYFASLCRELHSRGMKVILDGVFNHCGSFNKWMDHEGIYLGKPGYDLGAYQNGRSPYRSYFKFNNSRSGTRYADYEGWWGHETLPKLNYEASPELCEKILSIAEKWALPPYSIDGWRLDVAADLGHSEEFNHKFWREFRRRLKSINPNLLIIAEHYGDASSWLEGDQWDTVMNYDAFMDPVSLFLTGMEKHSDSKDDYAYRNGEYFFSMMLNNMARFENPSLQCAMNELSNHDHSRFLTRTNRLVGRMNNLGSDAASRCVNKAVLREAVAIQMTWPGAPTVYYGDEAGQVGWTDPDNRRTYPWGSEDQDLIALHRELIKLHSTEPVFKTGSLKPLLADTGIIAYARFNDKRCAVVAVNNNDRPAELSVPVAQAMACANRTFARRIITTQEGYSTESGVTAQVENGYINIALPPESSAVYIMI